jgi:hypothetical protein
MKIGVVCPEKEEYVQRSHYTYHYTHPRDSFAHICGFVNFVGIYGYNTSEYRNNYYYEYGTPENSVEDIHVLFVPLRIKSNTHTIIPSDATHASLTSGFNG